MRPERVILVSEVGFTRLIWLLSWGGPVQGRASIDGSPGQFSSIQAWGKTKNENYPMRKDKPFRICLFATMPLLVDKPVAMFVLNA